MASKDAALSAALKLSAVWNESQLLLGASTYLAQFWSAVSQVPASVLVFRCLQIHAHLTMIVISFCVPLYIERLCACVRHRCCVCMQLVFIKHWRMCEATTDASSGGRTATLAPVVQEVLIATLQRVEALCSLEPREAGIGLTVAPPSTAILHLLQSMLSNVDMCHLSLFHAVRDLQGCVYLPHA